MLMTTNTMAWSCSTDDAWNCLVHCLNSEHPFDAASANQQTHSKVPSDEERDAALDRLTVLVSDYGLAQAKVVVLVRWLREDLSSGSAGRGSVAMFKRVLHLCVPSPKEEENNYSAAQRPDEPLDLEKAEFWYPLQRAVLDLLCQLIAMLAKVGPKKVSGQKVKAVSHWVQHLLRYCILGVRVLHCLYEPLFSLLSLVPSQLQSTFVQLLLAITTERSQVTPWRVTSLRNLIKKHHNDLSLRRLYYKYQTLAPDRISETLKAVSLTERATLISQLSGLNETFQRVWKNRNSLDREIDELRLSGRISWEQNVTVRDDRLRQKASGRKGTATVRRIANPLPDANCNPLSEVQRGKESGSKLIKAVPYVEDLLTCIGERNIELPGSSLSLLRHRSLFIFFLVNEQPREMQDRLSITLYHTLNSEFLDSSSGSQERRRYLLQRAHQLQDFFQQGIPVVTKFLGEYLVRWNGKDFFLEIMALISYVQITDFEELHDVILSPIVSYFESQMTSLERLLFLLHLHKLLVNWVYFEHDRCMKLVKRVFGTANADCRDPLLAIDRLIGLWTKLAERGLLLLSEEEITHNPDEVYYARTSGNVYFCEILSMCLKLLKILKQKQMPLRPTWPSTVVSHAEKIKTLKNLF